MSSRQPPHRGDSYPLLKRMLHEYVAPHKTRIFYAVICMVIAAAATAANAWMIQPVLDEIFVNRDEQLLMLIPIIVGVIAFISGIANYGQSIFMRYVGQQVIADMQMALFAHLMRADLGTFHDQSSGRLISRFTNDIQMMRHSISNVLTGIAKESLTMIFLVCVMVYQSVELSLLALVGFPFAILPIARLGRRMRKISDGTQKELGEFTAQLDENFQGARVIKAYGRETFETERAQSTISKLTALYFKAARVQSAASPMMETIGGIAVAGVIWYGGSQVLAGTTSPGAFFSFITAMLMAYKPAKALASMNTHLQEGLAAASRFFEVMDTEPAIQNAPNAKALELHKGAIRFDDVSFSYPTEHTDKAAGVQHIAIDIAPNTTVALVGASGSGKSTLMNLLLRFYDIDAGSISIDDQDIRSVTLESLREHVALVSQEIVLFDDTVRANIGYGDLNADENAIIEAAKQADAHEFISKMPDGYDTMIGPHGVKLSGGQRQRLSIARAMLKNAPILLLDEATSALDNQSERSVQKSLEALMQQRTTLVIAHRLSTIRHADCIYVMDGGRVMESGTHDGLIAQDGLYRHLYELQFASKGAEDSSADLTLHGAQANV
ncbi:MAG: ABC transporter ATP-binding protein/permease [Rickettsiales bacterium]|nr:ABC transporter ATP-binding protein/permease [Rickettsiales bacterium]